MNQHYKKLGFKTPKNYFQKSKDQILDTNINYRTKKFEYQSRYTFQLLIAAVFITSILYLNFSSLNTESKNFSSSKYFILKTFLCLKVNSDNI